MAADLITIIETVAVTQLLTPTGKALGETILERGKQMASKAMAYLAAVGRQPQTVEEKLLVPMALWAGLESNATLSELWAALLANAADPAQQAPVQPAFADMLRQLAPADVRILQALYSHQGQTQQPTANWMLRKELAKLLSLSTDEVELATENLQRLGLGADAILKEADVEAGGMAGGVVATTLLGLAFMRAVTPPTP